MITTITTLRKGYGQERKMLKNNLIIFIYLTNIIFSETDKLLLTLSNLTMYKTEEISLDGDQSIV